MTYTLGEVAELVDAFGNITHLWGCSIMERTGSSPVLTTKQCYGSVLQQIRVVKETVFSVYRFIEYCKVDERVAKMIFAITCTLYQKWKQKS